MNASAASSGMQAFGELLAFIGLGAVVAALLAAIALYRLRTSTLPWVAISRVMIALAALAPLAAIAYGVGRSSASSTPLRAAASLAVLRLLLTPVGALFCAVPALLAPTRELRKRFLPGVALELGAAVCFALALFASRA